MAEAALGLGICTFREAAHFSRLRPLRVQRWFVPSPKRPSEPILTSDYDPIDGSQATGLTEASYSKAFPTLWSWPL